MLRNIYLRTREVIQLWLYNRRQPLTLFLRWSSLPVGLSGVAAILYNFGFFPDPILSPVSLGVIHGTLAFYVVKFVLLMLAEFHPLQFIRQNWFEGFLMLIIAVSGGLRLFYGQNLLDALFVKLNLPLLPSVYIIFVQFYFLIILLIELGRVASRLDRVHIGPAGLLTLSFIVLILSGAFLLMMPRMTTTCGIRFIDALFTSTSACCVTGLTVVDTATFFTPRGHGIIMLLIQLGGINIISFATFFTSFYKNLGGLKYQSLMKDLLSTDQLANTRSLLRRIILYSFLIEAAGAALIYWSWHQPLGSMETGRKVFFALFHSVSAFNNAGFALFSDNLAGNLIGSVWTSHLVIALLIIAGGLGFLVLQDVFSPRSIYYRWKHPWRKLETSSKVVLLTSGILIVAGMVVFLIAPANRATENLSWGYRLMASFFQSVSARTAGFNTVDISLLPLPVLLFFIILMFIGASPGSTGGGIKTTTFAVLIRSSVATLRREKHLVMFRRNIPFELLDKAYTVVFFSMATIVLSTFLLTFTDPAVTFIQILFEEVSAFATVGLSTGITPQLSDAARFVLILSMFIGRVGTLTLGVALTSKVMFTRQKFPSADIPIG